MIWNLAQIFISNWICKRERERESNTMIVIEVRLPRLRPHLKIISRGFPNSLIRQSSFGWRSNRYKSFLQVKSNHNLLSGEDQTVHNLLSSEDQTLPNLLMGEDQTIPNLLTGEDQTFTNLPFGEDQTFTNLPFGEE